MLALYDADGNALRAAAPTCDRTELYEQLLTSFAQREIAKPVHGCPTRNWPRRSRRTCAGCPLSAFAMFNRRSQWVTEDELDTT